MDSAGRLDLPGLLVSNEGNFRNLQVERGKPQGHCPDSVGTQRQFFLESNDLNTSLSQGSTALATSSCNLSESLSLTTADLECQTEVM